MNERIKELAEQAKIEFTYDPTETPMRAFAECWGDELEKFAELIVKECVMCMYRRGVEGFGMMEERMLKEHFGVEE